MIRTIVNTFIPGIQWIHTYKSKFLKGDCIAGLTVAVMLVPQAMGYALLAGLPPVIGLYASTVPIVLYAFFGSSKHLAVGPVAMVSLLVFSTASGLAPPGSPQFISLVVLISLISGAMQIVLGICHGGFIVNFISDAVIVGFTSAAALIIAISQTGHLLGITLKGGSFIPIASALINKIDHTHLITLGLSVVCIFTLLILKKKAPQFPAGLLTVVSATLFVYLLRLDEVGVAIIGTVPQGIPRFSLPNMNCIEISKLLPGSATIVFVGYMESIAIARSLATRGKYAVSPDNELLGLGAANIGAAFFSGYPVTGGLSRTAVNYDAGANTPLASLFTAGIIVLTLLFFTPLFHFLPKAVLASIIVVAVAGLVEVAAWRNLFRIRISDGIVVVATFLATLFIGIEYGILLGIAFSLILFLWLSAHPGIVELGFVKEEDAYLNRLRYPLAVAVPNTLILRIDGPLFFANTAFIENYIRNALADKNELNHIVINFSGVNNADAVSIDRFRKFIGEYERQSIQFSFAEMKGVVRDLFLKAKWQECCNQRITYISLHTVMQEMNKRPVKGGAIL